jgi:hypothetical protein
MHVLIINRILSIHFKTLKPCQNIENIDRMLSIFFSTKIRYISATVKGTKVIFLSVLKSPTQIGFENVRNSDRKFS